MNILGIETSCDETGVAIVNDQREVLSHLVVSQIKDHQIYGGVVPEIAARSHLDHLDTLIRLAMTEAKIDFHQLDGVAATCGPGLIGGVMVGMMAGKAIALAHNKPFLAVNHLEAHALTPRLIKDIPFPYLVLLVSGGHTQILVAENVGHYHLWATTRDDAVGECFDKAAKLMGLPYPGGPNLEKLAGTCLNAHAAQIKFPFSIPMQHSKDMAFSFSGLKTAVRNAVQTVTDKNELPFLAASFQDVLAKTLALRAGQAMSRFHQDYPAQTQPALIVCGGVSANMAIRESLEKTAKTNGFTLFAPPLEYCTDNGAMVAWAGVELLKAGRISSLNMKARPRWPLAELKDTGT